MDDGCFLNADAYILDAIERFLGEDENILNDDVCFLVDNGCFLNADAYILVAIDSFLVDVVNIINNDMSFLVDDGHFTKCQGYALFTLITIFGYKGDGVSLFFITSFYISTSK